MIHEEITVMPTQWASLKYMSELDGLNAADMPCLSEIRDVLKKYGKLERFGISLLHKHFEIANDEIMVESIDFEKRELKTMPMNRKVIGDCVETGWSLGGDDAVLACAKNHCYSTCITQEKTYRELQAKKL